jgi:hypothetical protein
MNTYTNVILEHTGTFTAKHTMALDGHRVIIAHKYPSHSMRSLREDLISGFVPGYDYVAEGVEASTALPPEIVVTCALALLTYCSLTTLL